MTPQEQMSVEAALALTDSAIEMCSEYELWRSENDLRAVRATLAALAQRVGELTIERDWHKSEVAEQYVNLRAAEARCKALEQDAARLTADAATWEAVCEMRGERADRAEARVAQLEADVAELRRALDARGPDEFDLAADAAAIDALLTEGEE